LYFRKQLSLELETETVNVYLLFQYSGHHIAKARAYLCHQCRSGIGGFGEYCEFRT